VANEDCSILSMGKDDFMDVLYRSPDIALELFKDFTQRIRQNNEHIQALTAELEKLKREKSNA
jgi:CRP-like cAMP-binding protein